MTIERPTIAKDEHLKYLDKLKNSGVTNMFGGSRYLTQAFGLKKRDAQEILVYWMESFNERHSND